MSNFEKIASAVLLVFFGSLVTLFTFSARTNKAIKNLSSAPSNVDKTSQTGDSISSDDSTPSATIEELSEQINDLAASSSSLLERIEELEEKPATTVTRSVSSPAFQKQIVYIGSASTTKREWTDSGVEIKLNSSDYPSNINAVFEVGLAIVGGEAWARLVNKTTGSIMAISEISHSTSTTTWKTSPSFKLFSGNNTYALQIRSTSGEVANFSGARIVLDR